MTDETLPAPHPTPRPQVGKKLRFEVFKRDGFVCQYCGASPPAAILHADHVDPVANGGETIIDNLVTACADCNLGKGARSLRQVPQSLAERAQEIAEREEQLAGYQAIRAAKRARIEGEVLAVVEVYERFDPRYTLSESARVSVRRFIENLGVHDVIEAMEIACSRCRSNDVFTYFCGVCWSKIRETRR